MLIDGENNQFLNNKFMIKLEFCIAELNSAPTFGHANVNFSVFIDRIRNQFLKK